MPAPTGLKSAQREPHPRLEAIVRRHVDVPWRGGRHEPTTMAFARLREWLGDELQRGVILDSGCGTGASTRSIALAHPDSLVIGIDRSSARLRRLRAACLPYREGNAVWVRAELAAFWRLAARAGWRVERHYLLYPNPWPKASQLRRRWHGHAVFPTLLALGGQIELRTNWAVYAEEFARAARVVTGRAVAVGSVGTDPVTSPFERKYRARGEKLFAVRIDLSTPEPTPAG